VQPNAQRPFAAVLVIHENRGLNPYIEDVARRVATEGFLALAPDELWPVGGYPGNDDDGRTLQASLDQGKLRTDMVNSALLESARAVRRQARGRGFLLGRQHAVQQTCFNKKMKIKNMTTLHLANSIRPANARRGFLITVLAIACFALSVTPKAFGVSPPPDGGYSNFNTAEGNGALFSLTSGADNTAIGYATLNSDTNGYSNTATGALALLDNRTGHENTAIGVNALASNKTGNDNTATGDGALQSNDASDNTATGAFALFSNTSGADNTANGFQALFSNNYGSNNAATGYQALLSNTSGRFNTATGYHALLNDETGDDNTATGYQVLQNNTTGYFNTATGAGALISNTSGAFNTAIGAFALFSNETGSNNITLGYLAGYGLTGNNNIDIGALGFASESGKIRIGTKGTQNGTFIAGIAGAAVTGSTVVVNSNGKLGITTSSARFKEAIKPMDKASEAILALKPVTFRYKEEIDPDGIPQFGLIAEQVEKVNPDLVVRDGDGKVNTVRYEAVNAMLLNEFLKAHKKIDAQERKAQEQEARLTKQETTISQLKSTLAQQQTEFQETVVHQRKQIATLTAGLQKVSDRLEVSSPRRARQLMADSQ
jgi:Chaperone of endosialidase/Dienelactone hydrolase family